MTDYTEPPGLPYPVAPVNGAAVTSADGDQTLEPVELEDDTAGGDAHA